MEEWNRYWSVESWRKFLNAGETDTQFADIRQCTHTGRPLGSVEFIEALEQKTSRQLAPRKGGRPTKTFADKRQGSILFDS
jgi:hypothetical protein